jgi:hypothetical protein
MDYSSEIVRKRMAHLSKPIDEAILNCDSREDVLMVASVMQTRLVSIYDSQIGIEGRKTMFRGLV